MTVRAVVIGGSETSSGLLRYILDRGPAKQGSGRVTYRDLAPGRHRLLVMLAGDHTVRASSTFVVRTPPPAPTPAPVQTTTIPPPPTTTTPPPPTTTTPPPPTTTTPPPPTTTTPAPPTTTTPAPSTGIPQNNGGDMDSDNSGGPSDGDGNV